MRYISFESDYTEGCHEDILNKLLETNNEQLSGYGDDKYSASAKEKIKKACHSPSSEVFFLVGGTQTNQIVIDTMLDSCECVISAETGHINTHEAGAIEYSGHKVIEIEQKSGKIVISKFRDVVEAHASDQNKDHTAIPKMLYISNPTEYGTLYTLEELREIREICDKYDLLLYMDGARLGYGLAVDGYNVTLGDIAKLCDAFYIGGTKVGAICGEAVVFKENRTPKRFFTKIKQHGALLAKGRLLGIQFDVLFTDELYFRIGRHAIRMADKLRTIFKENGYDFYVDSPTNQVFIVLDDEKYNRLSEYVGFSFWEKTDRDHTVVRFATSWATKEEDVQLLSEIIKKI